MADSRQDEEAEGAPPRGMGVRGRLRLGLKFGFGLAVGLRPRSRQEGGGVVSAIATGLGLASGLGFGLVPGLGLVSGFGFGFGWQLFMPPTPQDAVSGDDNKRVKRCAVTITPWPWPKCTTSPVHHADDTPSRWALWPLSAWDFPTLACTLSHPNHYPYSQVHLQVHHQSCCGPWDVARHRLRGGLELALITAQQGQGCAARA